MNINVNTSLINNVIDSIRTVVNDIERTQATSITFTKNNAIELINKAIENVDILSARKIEELNYSWDNQNFSRYPKDMEYRYNVSVPIESKEFYLEYYNDNFNPNDNISDNYYKAKQTFMMFQRLCNLNCEYITFSVDDLKYLENFSNYREEEFFRDGFWYYSQDHYKFHMKKLNKQNEIENDNN